MTSVLSLDLGGKNTGFFSFTAQDASNIDDFQSGTIIYDESFVLSQVRRRGKRHNKRNDDRSKMVKRLFLLILKEHYKCQIDFLPDEILGLFNKRGYTYASFEIKDDEKEQLESPILKEFLNDRLTNYTIKNDDEIEEFLNQIASNETTFSEYKKYFENLYKTSTHQPKKQLELIDEIKKELQKDDAKELLSGLKIVKKIIDEFDKQKNQGNLPREKYFEELNQEVKQNQNILEFFQSHNLQIQDMQNLIGNLSNYQLKELRRYFNDKEMAKGDIWIPTKKRVGLKEITHRFIQSWHFKKEDKDKKQKEEARNQLLKNLKEKNIIEFLTTTEPSKTIPPYDDMNNRGAVKCQTLRLNEDYLNIHLPNWRNIAHKLASEGQKKDLNISTVKKWSLDSTLLHRILDTSASIDPYELRSDKIDGYIDILGKNDALALQKFAKKYYELIKDKVRTGIWTSTDDMLKKCNHNPPYKNNQIHNLLAGILGVKIEADKFSSFETELWNNKEIKINRLTLSSYCKNIEELRKSHGNLFKSYIEELFKKDPKNLSKDEQKIRNLLDEKVLHEWVEKIGEFFGIDEQYRARFNNLFSMAQLYTIIDTQRSGFNSTCKWCSSENQHRAITKIEIDPQTGEITTNANCQRLPADTQRPFSGKIERYIDKLGYEIAKIKAKELENIQDKKIDLKIILEQNAFEYEESIRSAKIKNANAKAKKSLEDATKKYKKSLDDKDARIKSFSGGVCPYCGESLGDDGEIDHILPRSYTLKKYGTVFNSEGNLLYVHQKCNQAKKENIHKLSDIKAPITKEEIENQITPNDKKDEINYKTFSILTPKQQKAFKYALFLDKDNKAYKKVVDWLRTDQSSRVNGTQKYLAKKIQEKLKMMLPDKEFDFEFILADAQDVSSLRKTYAKENPLLTKPDTQPPSSHTIDAIMAFLSVYPKVAKSDEMPSVDKVVNFANIENWSALNNEFLTKGKSANQKIEEMIKAQDFSQKNMRQIFSKPIFGANALGERFKLIVIKNDNIYIGYPVKTKNGYDLKKCKHITNKNGKQILNQIIETYKNKQEKQLVSKNDKGEVIIYEIIKQNFNGLSNQYFNGNYKNLTKEQKDEAVLLEFIAQNCKYYTKKVNVKFAPSYKKEIDEMKYPFYNEWKLFDEAWQHLKTNENKKDFRDRYIIDKKQTNSSYQIDTKKGEYKLDGDIAPLWEDFCRWYFLDRFKKDEDIKKEKKRIKARKEFSLIAVGGTQGKVFRAKRKTPKGFVYQALPMDNNVIAGDYANVLIEANSKKLSLVPKSSESVINQLGNELKVKQSKDIRDIKLDPSKFFKDSFDYSSVEVILNKTSVEIINFSLEYFKHNLLENIELLDEMITSKKSKIQIIKKKLDLIINATSRNNDVAIKKIEENSINFEIAFRSENLSKLLND